MRACIPRKSHECRVCGERVKAGQPSARWSGVEPGEGWWTSHAHLICARFMDANRREDWECLGPGDYSRKDVEDWEYELLMGLD